MSKFKITDDNNNSKTYTLASFKIKRKGDCVIFKLNSLNYSVKYELSPDMRYPSLESVEEYLEKTLKTIVTNNYVLKISEYLKRRYISIGYETNDKYVNGQFTALKLNFKHYIEKMFLKLKETKK